MRPDIRHVIMKRIHGDSRMDRADYAHDDFMDERDYARGGDYARSDYADERRGVKGTGRGRRTRRDRAMDDRYFDEDEDYEKPLRIPRRQLAKWKHNLVNADGTDGAHFTAEEIMDVADKMRISYDGYTKAELCMATNFLYSDLGPAFKMFVPSDKEVYTWVGAAKLFLEDDDGPEGSEKLAAYFYCIADNG